MAEELSLADPNHPDNPNVLAKALESWRAEFKNHTQVGYRPIDNPRLWKLHVDHARALMTKKKTPAVYDQTGAVLTEEQKAAQRQMDILNGVLIVADKPVMLPPATAQTAAKDIAPASVDSDDAKAFMFATGAVTKKS